MPVRNPIPLTAARLNALQDAVIGVYTGTRGQRKIPLFPEHNRFGSGSPWVDEPAEGTLRGLGGGSASTLPLDLSAGDQLIE